MPSFIPITFYPLPEGTKGPPLRVYDSVKGTEWIEIPELMYLEGSSSYTWLYLVNGQRILIPYSIKQLAKRLPADCFWRIHRRYLVNRCFLEGVKVEGRQVLFHLRGGWRLPASRRCWSLLQPQLKGSKTGLTSARAKFAVFTS